MAKGLWGNVWTVGKSGNLNHDKTRGNFLVTPIPESPNWGNSLRARFPI